jgi:hypothetical protein
LPETKGKSLQEIEDYFAGRKSSLVDPKMTAGDGGSEITLHTISAKS